MSVITLLDDSAALFEWLKDDVVIQSRAENVSGVYEFALNFDGGVRLSYAGVYVVRVTVGSLDAVERQTTLGVRCKAYIIAIMG